MSFFKKIALCGAAASSTFVSTQSEASTVTIDFPGTVTSAYSYAQLGALPAPGGVSGGEQVVGSVTYDTNTATSVTPTYQYSNQSSQAFKFPTSGSVGYSYTINGTTWSSGNQIVVETANDAPSSSRGSTIFDQLWVTNNGAFGPSNDFRVVVACFLQSFVVKLLTSKVVLHFGVGEVLEPGVANYTNNPQGDYTEDFLNHAHFRSPSSPRLLQQISYQCEQSTQ
ncbi:hypothetical protein [Ruegeria atlantica]|uniref:Uncharacterized protein n=1 Tax=Ruegeria atlantica TaxID=81569 RepID=A0A0P1EHE6_9RHOB|nr:hypothetical protein [Ruegeria atlantica]CUH49800.1 hypothetical protein RUA4292_03998 [Ruegeria atlantica]